MVVKVKLPMQDDISGWALLPIGELLQQGVISLPSFFSRGKTNGHRYWSMDCMPIWSKPYGGTSPILQAKVDVRGREPVTRPYDYRRDLNHFLANPAARTLFQMAHGFKEDRDLSIVSKDNNVSHQNVNGTLWPEHQITDTLKEDRGWLLNGESTGTQPYRYGSYIPYTVASDKIRGPKWRREHFRTKSEDRLDWVSFPSHFGTGSHQNFETRYLEYEESLNFLYAKDQYVEYYNHSGGRARAKFYEFSVELEYLGHTAEWFCVWRYHSTREWWDTYNRYVSQWFTPDPTYMGKDVRSGIITQGAWNYKPMYFHGMWGDSSSLSTQAQAESLVQEASRPYWDALAATGFGPTGSEFDDAISQVHLGGEHKNAVESGYEALTGFLDIMQAVYYLARGRVNKAAEEALSVWGHMRTLRSSLIRKRSRYNQLPSLVRSLSNQTPQRVASRLGKDPTKVASYASGAYLTWLFAIKPAIDDFRDYYLGVGSLDDTPIIRGEGGSEELVQTDLGEMTRKVHVIVDLSPHLSSILPTLIALDRLGVVPTFERLWGVVPLSFLLDWFYPVAKRLRRVDTALFRSRHYDLMRRSTSCRLVYKDVTLSGWEGSVDIVYYRRYASVFPDRTGANLSVRIPDGGHLTLFALSEGFVRNLVENVLRKSK